MSRVCKNVETVIRFVRPLCIFRSVFKYYLVFSYGESLVIFPYVKTFFSFPFIFYFSTSKATSSVIMYVKRTGKNVFFQLSSQIDFHKTRLQRLSYSFRYSFREISSERHANDLVCLSYSEQQLKRTRLNRSRTKETRDFQSSPFEYPSNTLRNELLDVIESTPPSSTLIYASRKKCVPPVVPNCIITVINMYLYKFEALGLRFRFQVVSSISL